MMRRHLHVRLARACAALMALVVLAQNSIGQGATQLRYIEEPLPDTAGGGAVIELTVPPGNTPTSSVLLLNGVSETPRLVTVNGVPRTREVLTVRHGLALPLALREQQLLGVRWEFAREPDDTVEAFLVPMNRFLRDQALLGGLYLVLPVFGMLWGLAALAARLGTVRALWPRGWRPGRHTRPLTGVVWGSYLIVLSLFSSLYYSAPGLTEPRLAQGLLGLAVVLAFRLYSFPAAGSRWRFIWYAAIVLLPLASSLLGVLLPTALVLILGAARALWPTRPDRPRPHLAEAGSALALGLWAIIELIQLSPLGLRTPASDLFQLGLLITHLIALGFGLRAAADQRQHRFNPSGLGLAERSALPLLRKINHDLRSPIHGLLGMTSLLQDTPLSGEQREFVATAQSAGTQMQNQLDQLRMYTRLTTETLAINPRPVVIEDFIHETVAPFARMASLRYVEVVAEILPSVPARVRIDAALVQQVLRILLDNSVKFTESGVIQVTVRPEEPQLLRVRVDDTGRGLPPIDIQQLFDWPAAGRTSRSMLPEDCHLGLPVARHLIERIDGQIGASRSASRGSSFWFSVPYEVDNTVTRVRDSRALEPLRQQKVLIVDDYAACRKVLENQTRRWGMIAQQAASGEAALAMLQSHLYFHDAFDWVIIDYRMPEMNGLELLQKIRSIKGLSDIRVVLVTGVEQQYVEQQAHQYDVAHVLPKPVNPRELEQCLKHTD